MLGTYNSNNETVKTPRTHVSSSSPSIQATSKPGASSSSESSSDSEDSEDEVKNEDGFGLGDIIRATKNSPRVGSMSDRSTKPTPSPR